MREIAISVVIPTTLRSPAMLQAALESLGRQMSNREHEVLVIVNGEAAAGNGAIPKSVLSLAPLDVRFVLDPTPGVSRARNRGAAEATGTHVAFVDDDVTVADGWLDALHGAYLEEPEAVAIGGPIELRWPRRRPRWLAEELEGYYSRVHRGEERIRLHDAYPYGANMSVHRETMLAIGGFSTSFGRSGKALLSGEEKDFFARLNHVGGVILHEPKALVFHHVLGERVSIRWLLRRAYAHGRTQAIMVAEGGRSPSRSALGDGVRVAGTAVLKGPFALAAGAMRSGLPGIVAAAVRMWRAFGYARQRAGSIRKDIG